MSNYLFFTERGIKELMGIFRFRMAYKRRALLLTLSLVQLFSLLFISLGSSNIAQAAVAEDWPYMRVWERTDWPVSLGAASRSWYWGPAPFALTSETYSQAPGGARRVQYWDKSRMEITLPDGDQASKWYVTNGLLVREMVLGSVQIGDNPNQSYNLGPAEIPISGDPAEYNSFAPTYASFRNLTTLAQQDNRAAPQRDALTAVVDKSGQVTNDYSLATRYPETSIGYYEQTLGHNIPGPFWRFMNLTGPVSIDHRLTSRTIEDWTFAFGYPISEAYWTRSRVGGVEKDVLTQLFERRALTYTPSNPAGFQVEMGNVGRHYYAWRYGSITPSAPTYTQPPVRLIIPKLGVNAPVEFVGVLSDGNMDVPANPNNVGWYKFGARPGEIGNAVIDGHKDYYNIGAVVFFYLSKLAPGDLVYVQTSLDTRLTFKVLYSENYPSNPGSTDRIFGAANTANLNLVTCTGSFDSSSRSYNERLVVYTTLVN